DESQVNPTIVRVLTRLGAGGPPIHAVTLTRELSKLGYSSILVTGSKDRDDGDMSYLLRDTDPVHSIPEMSRSVSPRQDFLALVALYRFLRREKPSIVHTHTAKAGVLGRIAAPQQASELADQHHIASRDKIHLIPLGMDLSAFGAI